MVDSKEPERTIECIVSGATGSARGILAVAAGAVVAIWNLM